MLGEIPCLVVEFLPIPFQPAGGLNINSFENVDNIYDVRLYICCFRFHHVCRVSLTVY